MSNPTPILNNINAFDATQGATISFNIIGGTDIVRSNIVYIYDLSTNDLICTHLYISTESIHELPPNTDSSIVYASGKSSADFVNNKNYYLQIQTFTNTAGTAGGSGMSVAKTFWCLFNPALSVNAIPAAISTTSYNVGATYTTNVTDVTIPVTNIIQQYKFDLYTATGTLVQTSGNIIGSGEQEGTSTTYNITYNFSGLVVNNSYYVVVTTTSTEGMTVSAQSNTFTVSIETPTVGAATATNNSCDGYISVVSNLSSEYGGNVSGEIASFETDSVNNVSSLKVNMEPIQDLHGYDHPWVGGAGKNKYDVSAQRSITGGDNTVVIDGDNITATWANGALLVTGRNRQSYPAGTYTISANAQTPGWVHFWAYTVANNTEKNLGSGSITFTMSEPFYIGISGNSNSDTRTLTFNVQLEEGSTATAWTPYSNICPISGWDSVSASVVGKNLLDPQTIVTGKYYNNVLAEVTNAGKAHSGIIPIKPSTKYCLNGFAGQSFYAMLALDANKQPIATWYGGASKTEPFVATSPSNACYMILNFNADQIDAIAFYESETVDGYIPYNGTTYTTNLNQTVYGGTLDMATGVLTVDRAMVDLGTLDWSYRSTNQFFYASLSGKRPYISVTNYPKIIASIYPFEGNIGIGADTIVDKAIWNRAATDSTDIIIKDTAYSDPTSFKTAMNGAQLCYELAQPQTYQLTPHQIQTLVGQNNIWSDAGDVDVTFNLPISNLLVKRQDTSDVSGNWLTLYSQPITQASDMDFTFIDFLNQHGKTYRYALVPLLTQQQGDIDVEIEGGYTVSDDVLSVFDGVFIANSNGSQKLKAATEYGDLETNQDVGVLTTIGGKYPFVVSNSNLNYHSGSISALIVPSDFYTNGDLDRLDIVERREAIEQFLTDKTAKILKDWNGNIWLITFVDNVEVSFVDDYGMGLGTLSAKWVEIGDVNDQTDLQQTGLI